jgi:hypothetical protein
MFDRASAPVSRVRRFAPLRLIASAVFALLASAAHAQNLNFLKMSPIAKFTQEDVNLMMANANDVLDAREPSAKKEWSNPKTGASGVAEVRSEFVGNDGATCKRLRVVNKLNKDSTDVTHTVCKYEGRGWLLHSEAAPATKSQ